jgi:hypothetical protein
MPGHAVRNYPTPQRTDRSFVVKFSRMFDLID